MSRYVHKSHSVSVLLYHVVCPAKYRRVVFTPQLDQCLKEVCLEISKRYGVTFVEIGTDQDHVHFLVTIGADASAVTQNRPTVEAFETLTTARRPLGSRAMSNVLRAPD